MSEMKHPQEFSSRCCVHSEMTRQRQSSPSPALPTAPHIRTRGLRIFLFFILPWGCFLVEVKGWGIDEITEIVAGTIFRRTGGREEAKNPWNQAQDAAGQFQAATRRVLKHRNLAEKEMPYFDWVVALPSISRSSWVKRGYGHAINSCEVLLAEDLLDADVLRTRLLGYIKAKASYRIPFSREQLDSVREALGTC